MPWCDYDCPHASFPDERMLGACRTVAGIFCRKLGRVVPRHVPCTAEADGPAPSGKRRGTDAAPRPRGGKARG
ncbi:MAG: hypothetical protein MUC63_02880 [Planctomycetes bacterium]|nr:hypothetical protein [Planctomycetota bacterium]